MNHSESLGALSRRLSGTRDGPCAIAMRVLPLLIGALALVARASDEASGDMGSGSGSGEFETPPPPPPPMSPPPTTPPPPPPPMPPSPSSPPMMPPPISPDSSSDGLSGGGIAGIVLGVMAIGGFVGAAVYVCMTQKPAEGGPGIELQASSKI